MNHSPIWTAIYDRGSGDCCHGCYHIEIGHEKGQPISEETAKKLFLGSLGKKVKAKGYTRLYTIFPRSYENRFAFTMRCRAIPLP